MSSNNPVGSTAMVDLFYNAGNLDKALNSDQDHWRDRFGKERITYAYMERLSNTQALVNQSRELLRRSYTEVGLNLVPGSFEKGGVLVNANDVLLHEATGKCYSGNPGTVVPGTLPTSSGFVDKSSSTLPEIFYSVRNYGAKGDGITDDTQAIQAAIDAANPWKWQGTVQSTNSFRVPKRQVFLPAGTYRITSPLRLPPMITIKGIARMGWWSSYGSIILADFQDTSAYALDTANYDSVGNIQWGKDSYSRESHDNSRATQANCISLLDFCVLAKTQKSIKGGINLCLAHESRVDGVHSYGFKAGINLSTSWGGSFRDCNFVGAACGISLRNDITTWLIDNCYLTASPDYTDFDFPNFPEPALTNKTACIVGAWSSPHISNCTLEGAAHGIRLSNNLGGELDSCYIEKITDYGYVIHTSNIKVRPSWFIAKTAKLLWFSGSSANRCVLDLGNTNYDGVLESPIEVPYGKVEIIGNNGMVLGRTKIPSNVYYKSVSADLRFVVIHLDPNGDDNNQGYTPNYPVKTIQEAISRCIPGLLNKIVITPGTTILGKSSYSDGMNTQTKTFENLNVLFQGDSSNKPTLDFGFSTAASNMLTLNNSCLKFENLDILVPTGANDVSYKSILSGDSRLDVQIKGCGVKSKNPGTIAVLGANSYGKNATINYNFTGSVFTDIRFIGTLYGSDTYDAMWTLNHGGCSFVNCSEGDQTLKIACKPLTSA